MDFNDLSFSQGSDIESLDINVQIDLCNLNNENLKMNNEHSPVQLVDMFGKPDNQ